MKNLGDADRTARMFAGAILGICLSAISFRTNPRFWLGIVTVYLLATALAGWCPLYAMIRLNTRSEKDSGAGRG